MNTRSLLSLMVGLNLVLFVAVAILLFGRSEISSPAQSFPPLSVSPSSSVVTRPAIREASVQPPVALRSDSASFPVSSSPATTEIDRTSSDTARWGAPVKSVSHPVPDRGTAHTPSQPFSEASSSEAYTPAVVTGGGRGGSSSSQATLPAALVANDPSIPITTDQQVAEWERMQDNFLAEVGGPNQDLSDPENLAAWELAKNKSDEIFKAKFGWDAFLKQNTEAGRQVNSQ